MLFICPYLSIRCLEDCRLSALCVNYGIVGLIQLELGHAETEDMTAEQALAQYELLSFVAESFGIDEEVLNGACITPEFLAYGILIDGVPMLEYAMDHPDEFNNKDAPIARKEINKREREERKKAKKSA